jgi:twinkle protein
MACYQQTGIPSISLPNGSKSLPPDLIPALERYEKLYIWLDNDKAGQDGIEKIVKKLGIGRCYIVKPLNTSINENKQDSVIHDIEQTTAAEQSTAGSTTTATPYIPKDANDALLHNVDMHAMLEHALPIPHEQIVTFEDMRDDIKRELYQPHESRGIPSLSLPSLNRILKGHRRGELTIITGSTGVGKTTVLSQLSLDYCMQNVTTLWGSFEIKNSRLARTYLCSLLYIVSPHIDIDTIRY